MSVEEQITRLSINDDAVGTNYQYVLVFENPNKLPINQIHLERTWQELRTNISKDIDIHNLSDSEIKKVCFEQKSEILPALDKRWLPKTPFYNYQPYAFDCESDENSSFITNNILFLEELEFLIQCNYHQFWCTILFEPSAAISLRSFILNTMSPFQIKYLENEYLELYNEIYGKFLLVYEKLLLFHQNEIEYMPESFGISKLIDKKLLNLPIVITLGLLYKNVHLDFVNKISNIYFENPLHLDFFIKEVEASIDQNFMILEMLHGYLFGIQEDTDVSVPISIEKRPAVFSLNWVYSLVTYVLNTVATLNILFQFYKPAVEMALDKNYPYKLPYIYVNIYKELYELLEGRELMNEAKLYDKVLREINLGRSEFMDLYHVFVTKCLDQILENIGDNAKQEAIVEEYLRLMTTALEEDYFICDYNAAYNVANQNEMFQSCCDIDSTRTDFVVSCINKLPRNKKLEEFLRLKKQGIENTFRESTPKKVEHPVVLEDQPGPSGMQNIANESEIEGKIRSIIDMFPHLGDGFALQCLESYNFNTADVINAILENNLPPHLSEIPFDQIRIPPESEPEKPILAYKGKRPDYDDALKLLNDKKDLKEIKNLVLEGVQYGYDYMYDDEYDDRFDDDMPLKVPDNPLTEELPVNNPNRQHKEDLESDNDSPSEEEENDKRDNAKGKLNFCEDPAVIRERREARFRSRQGPHGGGTTANKAKVDVVGKAKGQGQEKSVLINRQKKNVNKSSHANHNRKSGAQWKRSRGMLPS